MITDQTTEKSLLYELNPLQDPRWEPFIKDHPKSSIYHSRPWLNALRGAYGYQPVVFTRSSPSQPLRQALVSCDVHSWLTGRRLVSLPFSDHCDPLTDTSDDLTNLISDLSRLHPKRWEYVEVRPTFSTDDPITGAQTSGSFCVHRLDLTPSLDELFSSCHHSSTQRKILRAQREALRSEGGRTESLLKTFFELLLLTRRRHRIPPQPKRWFRSLIESFGSALHIKIAFKGKTPIAGILTLRHKDVVVYKYGCSDARYHPFGGMHFLLWNAIRDAKESGARIFDLGRSDWSNPGLITFKDRWGAPRGALRYSRFPLNGTWRPNHEWKDRTGIPVFRYLPVSILHAIGEVMYRHIG